MKSIFNEIYDVLREGSPVTEASTKYKTAPNLRVELPTKKGESTVLSFSSGTLNLFPGKIFPDDTDEDYKKYKEATKQAEEVFVKAFEKAIVDISKAMAAKGFANY